MSRALLLSVVDGLEHTMGGVLQGNISVPVELLHEWSTALRIAAAPGAADRLADSRKPQPCPFCGHGVVNVFLGEVQCVRCMASVSGEDNAEAVVAWNCRSPSRAQAAMHIALKAWEAFDNEPTRKGEPKNYKLLGKARELTREAIKLAEQSS